MKQLTIEWVKENNLLVFEAIAGSRAYGLETIGSDSDVRGVFIMPKSLYYSMEYFPQVSNDTNDIVYYELKRYMELLSKNNPNILELLEVPSHCVLLKHAVMEKIRTSLFLSKLCKESFANYAFTQIKKAYGLEKKIVNPVDEVRKSVLDFCVLYVNGSTIPFNSFLEKNGRKQGDFGLAAIPHMKDCYNLFYSDVRRYAGVIKKDIANDVCLSSIPPGENPVAILYFNKDGYSTYCKKYKEYWDWVALRNEARYLNTMSHGKHYDSKNMMHVFRLLLMAKEIAIQGKVHVHRTDRDFLLAIKKGEFEYDELVRKAEELKNELPSLYDKSNLPDTPDLKAVNNLLVQIREQFYHERGM